MERQGADADEEPLLEADFPLPGSNKLPTVIGSPAALARLRPAPSSAAVPVASSSRDEMLDVASPLAGKRRGPESVSDAESSWTAEATSADNLAMVPLTPGNSHAVSLRRSSGEHKKPRPYYVGSDVEPPDKPSNSKGMQRGFLN